MLKTLRPILALAGLVPVLVHGRAREEAAPLVVESRAGRPELVVPAGEVLDYNVRLDLAVVGLVKVGNFRLSSHVDGFDPGLGLDGAARPGDGSRVGNVVAEAWGSHMGYELDHRIEMTHQPLDWPRVVYRDVQRGSENRHRELRYGRIEGEATAWYRSDRHCKDCERREHFLEGTWFTDAAHCGGCRRPEHRVWREAETRAVPEGATDMLGAVCIARRMVATGVEEARFPLLDREKTWDLELTQGRRERRKVPGGRFWCREMRLRTRPFGEDGDGKEFRGLFGIHGTLSIWLEERTGVPVEIGGTVPLGPLELEVSIGLADWQGVPEGFPRG